MKEVFAPGCALYLYKRHLIDNMLEFLGDKEEYSTCCHHKPDVAEPTKIINVCAGCDRRYGSLYDDVSTVSFWEIVAESEDFPFPDYGGVTMTILDACPTRKNVKVHKAVRKLMERMNINLIEPERTGVNGKCCGDTYYGKLPKEDVLAKMRERADEMPAENVVVYCVSCIKSMANGGKTPRYLVDLLFGEFTLAGTTDPDEWHSQLEDFIKVH